MTLPLDKIIILDLSRMLPGPYCTMILSDLGAEVIRVEDPNYPYSNLPPFFQKGKYRESAFNSVLMRNKKSITLNLKTEKAREIFYELVKRADVVFDTFRPKVMEKLKIDYNTLSSINPSIICCSMTGYGQYGPYEQQAGHDINYISISGILDATRQRHVFGKDDQERRPIIPGISTADIGGALIATIGIFGALFERENNPERKGQFVDISMTDSVFSFLPIEAAYKFSRDISEKTGEGADLGSGRKDLKGKQWVQGAEKEEVFEELEKEFLKKTQEDWLEIFNNYDTCVSPVKNFAEASEDPQILARNMIVNMDHPIFGEIQNLASPIKMSRTPPQIRTLAPKQGQNTEEVLKSLNYSDEDIKNLRKNKVV
ncbi:MAG: CaiB/BaiF CoA transferase family protein [Promethearchaeota archaeon]